MSGELRLGTRGSPLALTQSRWVKERIERAGPMAVGLKIIRSTGDKKREVALTRIGGKGVFTKELDQALLKDDIDLAVHSLKDLPTKLTKGLTIACIPERGDPRDVLIGPPDSSATLRTLPPGSRLGTGSLRRRALALAFRPDLSVESIRGNVDTRIRKLDRGEYGAIILAAAGIRRLDLWNRASELLDESVWLPAPGQGALAVVARTEDARTREVLKEFDHPPSRSAVDAERSLLAVLEGGCRLPIGALGLPYDGGLRLRGLVASPDGSRIVRADLTGDHREPSRLGAELGRILLRRGAAGILRDLDPDDS